MKSFYMYFPEIVFVFHLRAGIGDCSTLVHTQLPYSSLLLCVRHMNVPQIHIMFLFMEFNFFSHFYFCNNNAAVGVFGLPGSKGMRQRHPYCLPKSIHQIILPRRLQIPIFPYLCQAFKILSNLMDEVYIILI